MTEQSQLHPAAAYYAGAGQGARPAKDLTALGVLAFVAAAVATVGTCVSAAVLGRAARARSEQGLEAVDWSLGVHYAGTALAVLGLLAGAVTGAMWLHRARTNAEVLEPGSLHARRAGWAWGGWVTPVVSLWFPFEVVRDVRRALAPAAGSTALIGCWWALFLATEIGWYASFNLQGKALVEFDFAASAHQLSVITAAVMVAALAAWAEVLRVITIEQHERMYAG